jgi:hypothetical protein
MNRTHYVLLFKRLGLIFLLYTLSRVIFFLVNRTQYEGAAFAELAAAFLEGALFDLAAILLINVLFNIFSIIPFEFVTGSRYQDILSLFFQILNIPFLILNVINAGYFHWSGRVLTPTAEHGLELTTAKQIWSLATEYWYISLLSLLMALCVAWYDPSHFRLSAKKKITGIWGGLAIFITLTISVLFFAIMLKSHPLLPDTQPPSRESYLDNLSRNATFNLVSRFYDQGAKRVDRKE